MFKNIILLSLFFFVASIVVAQPGKVRERWEENLAHAEQLMVQQSYYNAAEKYKKVLKVKKNDTEIMLKTAEAYRLARNYKSAANYYGRLERRALRDGLESEYPLIGLKKGQMLKQAADYDGAEEALFVFKSEYKGEKADYYKAIAEIELAGIKWARKTIKPVVKIRDVAAMKRRVNSKYTEFAPMPYGKDKLLFSSLKSNEIIYTDGNRVASKMYAATLNKEGGVAEVQEFDRTLNTDGKHVGHGSFSADGKRLYFTKCEFEVSENQVNCQIYKSTKGLNGWTGATLLGKEVNMEGFESTAPFVASTDEGEDVLYYASNRPGGKGGLDLWVTQASSGSFAAAINLGNGINTIADETTPYLDNGQGNEDSRAALYFSSNGHPSMGGYDVFKSFKNNVNFSDWTKPVNAGKLLNTPEDDLYFVLDKTNSRAYFVSNRVGGQSIKGAGRTCCDDIFAANLGDAPVIVIAGILGTVYNEKNRPVPGAKMTLYDVTKKEEKLKSASTNSRGYLFDKLALEKNYKLVVKAKGYPSQEHAFSTKGMVVSQQFKKDFYLKKKQKPVDQPKEKNSLVVVGKTYSDQGQDGKKILNGATIEVIRINTKNGKEVSFKTLTSSGQGDFRTKLPVGYRYKFIGTESSHLTASAFLDGTNIVGDQTKNVELLLRIRKTDVTFKIENIYYDFNKATLREESIPNLQVLLTILNDNPGIKIELGSHTDSKGTNAYNQKLSQRRAQSVVDWLLGQGIDSSRLVAKGYGESTPVASNTNPDGSDNPDGRQLNRRTEFKLIE